MEQTTLSSNPHVERTFDRLPLSLPVEFRGPEGNIFGTTVNVSRGGMFVETAVPLPEGSRLFFRFRKEAIPMQFHLEGEVVWSRKGRGGKKKNGPNGMGVRFLQHRSQNDTTLENIFSVLHTMKS